jgi:hypothetical protein
MFVRLCWSSDGPVNLNGSYLSAQFPDVDAHSNSQDRYVEVPVTLLLSADGGNTADYVIQSPSTPTTFSADSWQWSDQTTASAPLRLTAVNTSASQHQTFKGFLSGIALGLAGGALIAILWSWSGRSVAPATPDIRFEHSVGGTIQRHHKTQFIRAIPRRAARVRPWGRV